MKTCYVGILLPAIFFIELCDPQISSASNLYIKNDLTFCRLLSTVSSPAIFGEKEKAEINISPNPASSTISVFCNKPSQLGCVLSVYDLLGRKVKEGIKMINSKIEIDVSDLQSGIYFLQIENKQEIVHQEKVVILH